MWRGHEGHMLSQDAVARRAAGRTHSNRVRQFQALARLRRVAQLLAEGIRTHAEIARRLHVHPSTISRDVQTLAALTPGACPTCGRAFARPWECQ
jgi:DNA-binding NarL/FixJ family response regulator